VTDNLRWLQTFYTSLCDGLWEHGMGFTIETLDNPGWSLKFDLAGTSFEKLDGPKIERGQHLEEDGPDWIILKKGTTAVSGVCGPAKLDEMIGEFRSWVEANS